MIANAEQIRASLGNADRLLIDARSGERFRGEEEPYDPVAGHIPGAVNRYWQDNLDADGTFLPAERLRREFEALLETNSPEQAVSYCGSGVTAAHNLLAMAHSGLPGARMYPGSWSEWCAHAENPISPREPESDT
jgi:thiosulfate/3-mercaptopyruvate sulfurtransferase